MKKKAILITAAILAAICLLCGGVALGINAYVKSSTAPRIITAEEAVALTDVDCILVLGCQVKSNGVPSDMLADRIRRGIELYQDGAAPKILMSGDHGQVEYNEVGTMKQSAIDAGLPSEDVFMDHAGFSTYESLCRAKEIFGVQKILIVTQEYHLYRALYLAQAFGIEAFGVAADYRTYWGQPKREVREILARCKDYFTAIYQPSPTYLGDAIPINGSGDQTND